jgi:hypothetical protein
MTAQSDMLERLGQTIDQAAAADVVDLVAEARLEARTKVRAILAEAIAERLLELAEAELGRRGLASAAVPSQPAASASGSAAGSSQQPAASASGSAAGSSQSAAPAGGPEETQDVACYVYGVTDADAELESGLAGVDGVHDVFLVRDQAVAAVVSAVPLDEFGERALREHLDDLAWLERRAHRHEQVLDRVRRQATLVPMRLCTIYRDERSVREMLAREHAFLADALERLAGRTEWGVKLYVVGDSSEGTADDSVEREESSDDPGSGASYLKGKRLQGHRRERAEAAVEERCEYAHLELARVAVEAKLNPVQPRELTQRAEPMAFNGVYLVDDAALDAFASAVDRLRSELAEHGLEPELTGPWPPYNFVGSPTEVGR